MIRAKYLSTIIILTTGLFMLNVKAQINPSSFLSNDKTTFYTSDQSFASYWFPLEILSWSPSNDPDATYNRSGVTLKTKYVD